MSSIKKISFFQKLSVKVVFIFVLIGIICITAVSLLSYSVSSKAILEQAFHGLEAAMYIKKNQVEDYFFRIIEDIKLSATRYEIANAIKLMVNYHNEMQIGPQEDFDMSSSHQNVTRSYDDIYNEIHKTMAFYCDELNYHDALIICAKHGHVMYSFAKEAELGTNLGHGKYRNTHLAELWKYVVETENYYITDMKPYEPSGGAPALFVGVPIIENSEIMGVFALQIPIDQLNKIMHERHGMGKTGETYLVGMDKLMRSDSYLDAQEVKRTGKKARFSVEASMVDNNTVDTEAVRMALDGKTDIKVIKNYLATEVLSAWTNIKIDSYNWAIIAEIDYREVEKPVEKLVIWIVSITFLLVIVLIIAAMIFSRYISNPIIRINHGIKKIADGDLTSEVNESDIRRNDEIGLIANGLNDVLNNMNSLIIDVKNTAIGVSSGASQVSNAAQSLSQGATELASSVEEMSASIEEMDSTVDQNTDNAVEGEKIASTSANEAREGGQAVNKTVEQMKKVAETIQIIAEIANNTNMLALNAAIEAARAGEQGEGFAVVATEVRKLAERTLKAAQEIKDLTGSSVEVANQAGKIINKTVPNIIKTSDMVQEIASASKEQKSGMKQLTNAAGQQDKVTQLVSANSEELASSSEQMSAQSQSLVDLVSKFKLKEINNKQLTGQDIVFQSNDKNQFHNNKLFQQKLLSDPATKNEVTTKTDKVVNKELDIQGNDYIQI